MYKTMIMMLAIFALMGCNKHRVIVSKRHIDRCFCSFEYSRIGSGEGIYFEDSCHLYFIGDTIGGKIHE